MKKLSLALLPLLVIPFLISCDKDDDGGDLIPDKKCKISSELETRDTDVRYSKYVYNEEGMIVKLEYSETEGGTLNEYDTLMYDDMKQLTSVKSYSPNSPDAHEVSTYTYTAGKITKIVTEGSRWDGGVSTPFTSVVEITYNGNNVATLTSSGGKDNMSFKDVVYSAGNISSLKLDMSGNGTGWVAIKALSYDDKNSVAMYVVPDWENILFGSSANNMKVMVFDEEVNMGNGVINKGDTILHNEYTYNLEGMVVSEKAHPTVVEEKGSTTVYTWDCE